MDRNRDARRAGMAAGNGLSRRRHRSSSLRDSPEDDGPVELQDASRLRDRKKDRDRDRDRERERDRDRDRDRDRISRSKRRRGDRLMQGSIREDGGDDSSEESVNDEDEDDDDDGGGIGGGSIRMLPPNPSSTTSISSSLLNHRRTFSPVTNLSNNKHFRPLTSLKVADEMIGVSVPRKARSASTKRSHEWPSSCGVVGEQIYSQASTSPVRPSTSAMAAPAPSSPPSSSHASVVRKKLKPNGPKLRPAKLPSLSKPPVDQSDLDDIEIAEVLCGMTRQPQVPSKREIAATTDSIKFESREANKAASEAKSRVSSPISNSPHTAPQLTSVFTQNSTSSVTSMTAVGGYNQLSAPKRKRPRPVNFADENLSNFAIQNNLISSTVKTVTDQPAKLESSSPNLEKTPGSAAENGGFSYNLPNSHAVPAAPAPPEAQPECRAVSDIKPTNDESESRNVQVSKEEPQSPVKESAQLRLGDNREDMTVTKVNYTVSKIEHQREDKFQIDLMAPPERDGEVDFASVDPKPKVIDAETEIKPVNREDNKVVKIGKEEPANLEAAEKSKSVVVEEAAELKKPKIDLQLDLEKPDRDSGHNASFSGSKMHHNVAKQQQQNTEKNVQPGSVPLPMSVAAWPGSLPPMGYMAPLQGVVSMDGSTVSSAAVQPPHLLFNQPRPKRCATHFYIARNIYYHQQMSRMNPFWPVAAGSGSLYGAKHCNPNVLPPELHGNAPGRGVNAVQDKGQGLAMFPVQSGKDKSSQAANHVDAASQRKQIVLQQTLPQGAPNNILHGPAFIFPLSQQHAAAAAAAASVRPGSVKSPNAGGAALSTASNAASMSATATAAPAPAMSFNYPNMAGSEPQYLAILQNNAYPFPMPTHVGAPPAYRGPHGQPMPYFNGSFQYSQMIHPSQLQQQQQPPSQSQQSQQGHQNPSISSGSSSSQKHLQNQQQRPHLSGVNGGSVNLQGFPAAKNQSSQALQLQQQRQQQHPHPPHQTRQLESERGGEDSPSTADSRVSRAHMNIYGQNFQMPMHPPNFALMTPPSTGNASSAAGASGGEKKQQQQHQGSKGGIDASQAYAMSFAAMNGATAATGIDLTSIPQNHAIIQNFPDAARQNYHQFMATTVQAAQQNKKNYRVPEEGKSVGGDSNVEEERKSMAGKTSSTVGHSIAFSRPDLTDASGSTVPSNNVIESSARTINLGSTPVRAPNSVIPAAVNTVNAPTPQQQMRNQHQQQQQQQMIQLQKQQHQYSAAARSKTPATSNGSVYSEHLPSTSSMAAKFPNALSSFPQNLVQSSSSSTAQSPQWKNSTRTTTSQVHSSALASSTSSSIKNLPQKHGRTQQSHTQISFAANTKTSTQSQGLQPASSNQSPSPPVMVGSPTTTTSSMSKSAGGSPRTTTSNSTGNKAGQVSSLSSQQAKNAPSVPSQKSSPVGGRNIPSILGNPHISSSGTGAKPQLTQQQHQQLQQQQLQQQHQNQQQHQQISKQSIQQAHLFFSSAYMQGQQATHSNSTAPSASPSSGYYHIQRCRPEQLQQAQGSSGSSSSGMLSLCPPVTHSNTGTTDPAKAVAAANMKGGALPSQTLMHHAQFAAAQSSGPHQLVPAGFPYVHPVPTIQVKPAEQKKQPAGAGTSFHGDCKTCGGSGG